MVWNRPELSTDKSLVRATQLNFLRYRWNEGIRRLNKVGWLDIVIKRPHQWQCSRRCRRRRWRRRHRRSRWWRRWWWLDQCWIRIRFRKLSADVDAVVVAVAVVVEKSWDRRIDDLVVAGADLTEWAAAADAAAAAAAAAATRCAVVVVGRSWRNGTRRAPRWRLRGRRWRSCHPELLGDPLDVARRPGVGAGVPGLSTADSVAHDTWGQFHKTKMSISFHSTWEETYPQAKNTEKSFNKNSEKFRQVEYLLYEIDPWTRGGFKGGTSGASL